MLGENGARPRPPRLEAAAKVGTGSVKARRCGRGLARTSEHRRRLADASFIHGGAGMTAIVQWHDILRRLRHCPPSSCAARPHQLLVGRRRSPLATLSSTPPSSDFFTLLDADFERWAGYRSKRRRDRRRDGEPSPSRRSHCSPSRASGVEPRQDRRAPLARERCGTRAEFTKSGRRSGASWRPTMSAGTAELRVNPDVLSCNVIEFEQRIAADDLECGERSRHRAVSRRRLSQELARVRALGGPGAVATRAA